MPNENDYVQLVNTNSESAKVNDKILAKIIKDVEFIFKDNNGISSRDKKIIKENYIMKQPSWESLGDGMKNVIGLVTPIAVSIYQNELIQALKNDMGDNNE